MKWLVSLLVTILAVSIYTISKLPVPFWIWIQVLTGIILFSVFAFPYLLAWVVNFFLSKGKRFSVSIDKLSLLGLNAKNVNFSIILERFIISGSVKKVGILTNFRKSFLNIGASSPFVLEVDSVVIGLIPNDGVPLPPTDIKKEPKEDVNSHQSEKNGNSLSALRHLFPLLRLLNLHINNVVFSLGDSEFPKRIEVVVSDIQVNGSVQFTPATTVQGLFSIRAISINNRENAFDSQPNFVLNSFWIRCSCEFGHRFLVHQLTWNVGDSLQIRIDKSLYRQIFAVFKAIKCSGTQKRSNPLPNELPPLEITRPSTSSNNTVNGSAVDKLSSLIRILPQALKVTLPKLEIDLANADKSNNTSTSIHILLGVTLKCSTSFYDVFASVPHSLMIAMELSTFQSNYLSCDGIEASMTLMIRESKSQFESISLNYTHRKTVLTLRPSILRTFEYIQSMLICLPFKSTSKQPLLSHEPSSPSHKSSLQSSHVPSSSTHSPSLLSLIKDSQIRIDARVEELQLAFAVSSCVPSPAVGISLQALTLTLVPANSRASLEVSLSSSYEFQAKIGAIEVSAIPYSRESLQSLLHEEEQDSSNPLNHLPPCSDKIVSLGGWELDWTMNKWERLSVESSLKSCNLVFTYSSVDLMLFVMQIFVKEIEDYKERSATGMNKTTSFSSLDFSRSTSSASLSDVSLTSPIPPSLTSPIPPSSQENPVILETMDSEEINRQLLQSILDGSLLPNGMEDVAGICDLDVMGAFTPSSSPRPLATVSPIQQSSSQPSPIPPDPTLTKSSHPTSPHLTSTSLQKNSIKQEAVSDGESDEILLSDDETDVKPSIIQFIPIYLSDATIRISSVEIQITGKDTSRSTSYTMESLNVFIIAKNNDTFEKYVSSLHGEFGETFTSQQFNLPVYSSPSMIPSQPLLSTATLSPVDERLDFNSIPHLEVKTGIPQFHYSPLPMTTNFYSKNPLVEYKITVEINNISVLGDEGIHVPKAQLPDFIPQIGITLPSFLFLSFSKSQLPEQLSSISFNTNNIEYKARSLGKWAGFYRGDEHLVLISSNSRDTNCLQIVISSLYTRLSFGSIYVFMNSLLELVNLVKSGIPKKPKVSDETPKAMKHSSPSFFKLMVILRQLTVTFHFTPKAGVLLTIEELAATYPDSSSLPLLSFRSIQASQIQMTQVTCAMLTVDSLAVYSPASYSEVSKQNGLDMNNQSISELREHSLYLKKCACGHCDMCHRFQPCSSCQNHITDLHQCNGYDNQCNLRTDHVPTGVQPYLIIVNKIDCFQDRRWPWGDLIYDACLQWKAFKTIRKGIRPPPAFPHPDENRANTVATHEAFSSSTILSGIWIQLVVDSALLRFQDIIPHLSPESREYSCLVVTGLDGVVTYNRKIHSRAHLLSFLQSMDESPTPLAKGFDDVLGLHVHDLYIDSVETSFADQPPLLAGYNLYGCGTFVLADMNRVESYVRQESVELF